MSKKCYFCGKPLKRGNWMYNPTAACNKCNEELEKEYSSLETEYKFELRFNSYSSSFYIPPVCVRFFSDPPARRYPNGRAPSSTSSESEQHEAMKASVS